MLEVPLCKAYYKTSCNGYLFSELLFIWEFPKIG